MKRRSFLLFAGLVFIAHVSFAAGVPDFQEGLWEITSASEMPGMPAMPAIKYTQCMTNKDYIPHGKDEKDHSCKLSDIRTEGSTLTWKMACKSNEGDMEGNGKIAYNKDKFDGSVVINVQMPGRGKMQMTNKMTGRRIGNCK